MASIREVKGGMAEAEAMFQQLARNGTGVAQNDDFI
ncbi:hypothetical protein CLV40_101331 [Actinokineospora auranticolor]|uniref:Uncharacterized protein n=1 Tax=Actinokineospora auranticolor TaxID=155976 RepID=A0A2S6H0X9_9PSEU|nr:hypothetical protein CLV40_101331 [Actinokineospora auranticolor]